MPEDEPANSDEDAVSAFVMEIRRRFGEAALEVARTQLDHATADTAPRWSEIYARLRG